MQPQAGEESSVTITRLLCQLVITLVLLILGVLIAVYRPELDIAVSLGIGTLIGAWFGIVRHEGLFRGKKNGS